jgi:hypothetical protein
MENYNFSKNPQRLDANETAFLIRQLTYIKTKSYDTKYKALKAATLIPVSTEVPSGEKHIDYTVFSRIGQAKIIANYAKDFPRVDIAVEEKRANVKGIGDSFGYNIPEIRAAARAGLPLNQRRANTATDLVNRKIDDIAWNGDTEYGLQGFIDFPGTVEYTVPNDGTGTSKLWSTKSPDKIVRDMSGLVTSVITTTKGVEEPDTLLLPLEQYEYINSTQKSDASDKTILKWFLENNVHIKQIEWLVELDGAGVSGTDRMMCYVKDPMNLTLEIPQVTEQFDPQQEGMEFKVPVHAETGGVIIYYPLSVAYGDGI